MKRKKNVSWFFRWAAILAVVLSVLTWVSVSYAEKKDDALIISMDRAYAPLTFVNSFGRPSGLLVDLWRTWAEKSGRKIKFRVSSWSETLEALKNGDADFHSGLSFSKEREKWIGFSTQIYATFARVYHRVGDPQPVGIGGYGTDGVGVMSGSYQETKFREAYPDVKTLSLVTTDDLINALLKSEVRAIIQEETIMGAALDRLGLHGDITSRSERLFPSTIHAGVLKKNTDLLQEIDKGLTLIPKSKLVEMEKRWTHNPEDRYYQPEAKSFKLSDDEKAWLAEHPNISVAINNAWPPMDFVTESGIPRGIGVDFVKALNKRIGGRLTIVPGSWADIYEQVKNRQLDALMDITPRENRKPYFNFTKPYASIPHVIIARKDGPYFGSIESLSGKTIALERGFYSVKFLQKNHPNIRIKEYASTSDALYAVAKEEADAYAGNRAVASYLMEKELLGNLQFQGKLKVTASVNSIGVRKDWPKLAQILDRAIDSMTRDEVRAIYKKWGGIGDDEYSEWIGLTTDEKTWLKAHPVIRVHNEKAWPPFNFFENGTPKGFSIDYMNLLASRLGIEIQYITGPTWNEFINMVKNNELDIMLNIARSPERETFLDFTHEPYVTLMQALYTRDDQPLISSIEDLYGKTFAMPKGFYLQEILKKYPKIKIHEVSNTTEAIRAVSIGKADVMFDLMPVVNYTLTPQEGLTWAEVLEKARNKEIDVISAIVQTPERSEYLHFTKPYISLPMMVVTREDSPYIQGIKDLKDKTIAVVREYVTQGYLEEDHPDQKLLLLDSLEDVLTAVSEGRADALVENIAVVNFVSKKLGITNLRAAAATPYFFELSYGVRKDWPELMPILEKALAAFSDQEKGLILDKWLNVQVEKRTDWKIVWLIIVIGTFVAGSILSVILVWNRRLSREVGERKRAEERFQTIAATTSGAIIQTRFDAEGRPEYLYLSAKAEEFFGMPPDQVIQGKQRLPWYHGDQKRIHEEIRTISSAGGDMNLVGRIQPAEGEIKWIRINASPSHSPEGGVIYNGFILDITERKLAEQEFIKSERKNKAMSQAVDDALVMINGKGKVMFWNQAAVNLFGYTAEEAMGMDFHKMAVPEAERVKSMAGLERFSRTGEGAVIGSGLQVRAKNRKGEEFPVEVSISAFQVDDEWFAVGTVRDITDRKKAEEELQQNLEDLERFSSMVIGREEKMIQLKEEINELLIQSGKGEKYKIVQ